MILMSMTHPLPAAATNLLPMHARAPEVASSMKEQVRLIINWLAKQPLIPLRSSSRIIKTMLGALTHWKSTLHCRSITSLLESTEARSITRTYWG